MLLEICIKFDLNRYVSGNNSSLAHLCIDKLLYSSHQNTAENCSNARPNFSSILFADFFFCSPIFLLFRSNYLLNFFFSCEHLQRLRWSEEQMHSQENYKRKSMLKSQLLWTYFSLALRASLVPWNVSAANDWVFFLCHRERNVLLSAMGWKMKQIG